MFLVNLQNLDNKFYIGSSFYCIIKKKSGEIRGLFVVFSFKEQYQGKRGNMNWDALLSKERLKTIQTEAFEVDLRDEFEKDQQIVIQSAAFRRLQDKTQVFPLDKNDFVRTRLTHSLETAFTAKQLANMTRKNLKTHKKVELAVTQEIPDILFCAGLLHDIGNPPFGHFGETIIRDWFKSHLNTIKYCQKPLNEVLSNEQCADLLNFEGNAQALRAILKLPASDYGVGMNLTFAVINTLIKYPCSSVHINAKSNYIQYHKMGFFQADEEMVKKVCTQTGTLSGSHYKRHPLTFLLEAADDISYGVADVEDAFKKGLFTYDQLESFISDKIKNIKNNEKTKKVEEALKQLNIYYGKGLRDCSNKREAEMYAVQNWLQYVKGWLMYCAAFSFSANYKKIMGGVFHDELLTNTYHEETLEILKSIARKYAFTHSSIMKLEISAHKLLNSLLDKFVPAIIYFDCDLPDYKQKKIDKKVTSLLSSNHVDNYKREVRKLQGKDKDRDALYLRLLLVTDFLSGMTDTYAKTLYHELDAID